MRGLRSFGVLLVVLRGARRLPVLRRIEAAAGGDADKKDKVFTVEADKIEEFTIKSESGERTTLRKNGTDWQIVAAGRAPSRTAPKSRASRRNLASLEIQRVIDENPADLAEYSLAQPRIEVTFKAAGKEHKLLIGRKTPPGSDLYAQARRSEARRPDPVVRRHAPSTSTTFDLRDKAVLTVDRDEIGALAVTTPPSTMQLREGRRRVEDGAAGRGARRLQRRRRAGQPADTRCR